MYEWFVRFAFSFKCMCGLLGRLTPKVNVWFVRLAYHYKRTCGLLVWLTLTSVCVVC